jgi:DNA-binding MarR family transcriptional regulator
MLLQDRDGAPDGAAAEADGPLALDGLGARLREANRAYTKALQDRLAEEGVPFGLWYFLCALWEEDGLSQKELSRRVGTVEPTAVGALAQMERRGWVVRDRDTADQRRRVVCLTEQGRALRSRLEPIFRALEASGTAGLDPREADELRRLLQKVTESIEAAARDRRI